MQHKRIKWTGPMKKRYTKKRFFSTKRHFRKNDIEFKNLE